MKFPLNNKKESISEGSELSSQQNSSKITATQNLVINGGAESGTMYGWDYVFFGIGNKPHSGSYSFGTSAAAPATSILSQNLDTLKGASYNVQLYKTDGGANTVNVFIDGVLIISSTTKGEYSKVTGSFIATSDTVKFEIQANTQANWALLIDDIAVTFRSSPRPTTMPTAPSMTPTLSPTKIPTNVPTTSPSVKPTSNPTKIPTNVPTELNTFTPTILLTTENPTHAPTLPTTPSDDNAKNNDLETILSIIVAPVVGLFSFATMAYFANPVGYKFCSYFFDRWDLYNWKHDRDFNIQSVIMYPCNQVYGTRYIQSRVASRDFSEMNQNIEMNQVGQNLNQNIVPNNQNALNEQLLLDNGNQAILLSIDAMMEPNHVEAQNKAYTRFGGQLVNFVMHELPKDINWLLTIPSSVKTLFLEDKTQENNVLTTYLDSTFADNTQFIDSNHLMFSLLSTKQILYHLPIIQYLAQNTITYLGYNITIPNPLDNKELLICIDSVISNLAAQCLPAESVMNGVCIAVAGTANFAITLEIDYYLKNHKPSEEPIGFTQQCAVTIAAYSLPGVVNYALTKAILPDAKMSINALVSSSFGVVQCYNDYKSVYGTEAESTTTDIVVPYIVDAITLWSLRSYISDTSDSSNLIMSIKNAMSVAAITYAADCFTRMLIDVVPQEIKEDYLDLALNPIIEIADAFYQSTNEFSTYIYKEANLIMEYIGA